jgi:hypothetical protein
MCRRYLVVRRIHADALACVDAIKFVKEHLHVSLDVECQNMDVTDSTYDGSFLVTLATTVD